MLFSQLEYPLFLALVAILAWATPRNAPRKVVLLAASYYFYAYWDVRFLGLIWFSTLLDWLIGLGMGASSSARVRRGLLVASLCGNLGLLGFFKYYNFFIDSARAVLGAWGWHAGGLEIVLPVGISFYTFQTLSYTIDVYRGAMAPRRSLLDFALYVAFFPQLVAGPIVRAIEFLPQLDQRPRLRGARLYSGMQQILRGAVKKLLIADSLALAVDPVFAQPEAFAWGTVAFAVVAYAGQIYGDFSGYTDMAIGSARVLGFELPENFRHPYLATSIREFWHRWHISLSTWLRDYLYVPLGGSRYGRLRTVRNVMITMTLGGLWHGAAWTFVLWGVWHGVMLAASQWRVWRAPRGAAGRLGGWAATMAVVLAGWVLFRAEGLGVAGAVFRQLAGGEGLDWFPARAVAAAGILAAEHLLWLTPWRSATRLPVDRWYSPVLTAAALWALVLLAPQGTRPFVYFQF